MRRAARTAGAHRVAVPTSVPRQKGRQEHTALFLILGPLPPLFATLRPVPLIDTTE